MEGRNRDRFIALVFAFAAATMVGSLVPHYAAAADKEKVLYSFCSTGGVFCTDGPMPSAALLIHKSGNLSGTTPAGGAYDSGTVFTVKR